MTSAGEASARQITGAYCCVRGKTARPQRLRMALGCAGKTWQNSTRSQSEVLVFVWSQRQINLHDYGAIPFLYGLTSAILIFGRVRSRGRGVSGTRRVCGLLGEASYALYLNHYPIIGPCARRESRSPLAGSLGQQSPIWACRVFTLPVRYCSILGSSALCFGRLSTDRNPCAVKLNSLVVAAFGAAHAPRFSNLFSHSFVERVNHGC
jgi:peptidoglycan/LPS O-acetylase OafA/YrhL